MRRATRPFARILGALRQRMEPPVRPAEDGPIAMAHHHLSPAVAATVEAWFRGEIAAFEASGERSVLIAHPEKPELRLKIKGAGFKGQPLGFNHRHRSNLRAPRFDFDGRMMEDVAAGHDNTWSGGASFQQAAVEHAISVRLDALGYATVPCLGHGMVTRQDRASWFSVFEVDPRWRSYSTPHTTIANYCAQTTVFGAQVLELATQHQLIGYYWYMADPAGGPLLIKDVHPFYAADPINMSRLSWVMQVLYALHIVALTTLLVPRLADDPGRPADSQAFPFRDLVADASVEDHQAVRAAIVAPYMRGAVATFSPRTLHAELKAHRITAALMERCPPQYAAP